MILINPTARSFQAGIETPNAETASTPMAVAPTCAAPAAHPGQPRLSNPAIKNTHGQRRSTRANAQKMLSPVASVHRCNSVLITNWVSTPTTNAQKTAQPNCAVRTGQNSVSPLPSEAPSMIADGPTMWLNRGTRGRSASLNAPPVPRDGCAAADGAASSSSYRSGRYHVLRYCLPSTAEAYTSSPPAERSS
jgi:hypothetical protein